MKIFPTYRQVITHYAIIIQSIFQSNGVGSRNWGAGLFLRLDPQSPVTPVTAKRLPSSCVQVSAAGGTIL
jgi:hypothetical protein